MKEFSVKRSGRTDWEEVVMADSIRKAAESFVLGTSVHSSDKILVVENKAGAKQEKQTYIAADVAWRKEWEVDDDLIKPEEEERLRSYQRKLYVERMRRNSNYTSLRTSVNVFTVIMATLIVSICIYWLYQGASQNRAEIFFASLGCGIAAFSLLVVFRLATTLSIDFMESSIDENSKK